MMIRGAGAQISIVFLMAAVVLAGCTAGTSQQTTATAPDDKPYRFESEGQTPPPPPESMRQEVDRVDVFEETPVTEGAFVVESVEPVEEITEAEADSVASGPGYRVQLFASGEQENAKTYEMEVEMRLGIATYLEYLDGMYKVRVGDCRTRQEAENLRDQCRAAGYQDAWIVSTVVNLPRTQKDGSN